MITKKEFFNKNHLTHTIIGSGIAFISGFIYLFSDLVSGIAIMVASLCIGLIVWFAGSDYYNTRLKK